MLEDEIIIKKINLKKSCKVKNSNKKGFDLIEKKLKNDEIVRKKNNF
jgi:hypothetical protein